MMTILFLLRSWSALNEGLHKLTEQECATLLKAEKLGPRRLSFLIRIYGRFNRLRTTRERNELTR